MKNVLFAATIVLINGFTCFAQREPAASQEIVSIDKEMFEKLTGTYQMTIKDKGEIRYATWSYRFLNDQYYVKKETSGSPDELYFNFIVKSVEYEDRKYKVRKDNPEMYYIMSAKLKGESTVISETIQNQSQMYQIFINGKYQGVAKQPNGKIEHQKAIPINIRNNGLIQSNHSNIFIAKATKKLKTLQISDEETKRILTIVLFDNLYTNKDIPLISKGVLTNRFPDNASSYLYIPIKETDKSELLNSEIIDAEYKPYNEYGTLDYTDIGSQVYNARNLLKKICNGDSWYVSNERKNNDRLDITPILYLKKLKKINIRNNSTGNIHFILNVERNYNSRLGTYETKLALQETEFAKSDEELFAQTESKAYNAKRQQWERERKESERMAEIEAKKELAIRDSILNNLDRIRQSYPKEMQATFDFISDYKLKGYFTGVYYGLWECGDYVVDIDNKFGDIINAGYNRQLADGIAYFNYYLLANKSDPNFYKGEYFKTLNYSYDLDVNSYKFGDKGDGQVTFEAKYESAVRSSFNLVFSNNLSLAFLYVQHPTWETDLKKLVNYLKDNKAIEKRVKENWFRLTKGLCPLK